ncbi:hypothetical protein MLP_10050 [Microlunatus phosphovorus NM-1]|uniref:Uncharacterized protein n=2 Tax=Microlunatus phosphovorus TaxID=29405 RepID=F5XMU6_MICPN|nr:hypothetical protein MLP_10050 [Microlunatus phosphovorus NM-1]
MESEHQRRPARAERRDTESDQPSKAGSEILANPLLQLQRDAGNAAVANLLAVQRHTLDPEEEAGS